MHDTCVPADKPLNVTVPDAVNALVVTVPVAVSDPNVCSALHVLACARLSEATTLPVVGLIVSVPLELLTLRTLPPPPPGGPQSLSTVPEVFAQHAMLPITELRGPVTLPPPPPPNGTVKTVPLMTN